jgi:preprotein translocase subunit SecD
MNKAFRILIVLIAIGIAVWGFSSTYTWYFRYSKEDRALTNLTAEVLVEYPEEKRLQIKEMKTLRGRIINLGLDLQGGIYMVLEPDYEELQRRAGRELTSDEIRDAIRQVMEILRNRIDKFGVSEPSITTQGEDRIVVELPGSKDPDRARTVVMGRGLLEFKIVDEVTTGNLRRDMFDDTGLIIDSSIIPSGSELKYFWSKNQYDVLERRRAVVLYDEVLLDGSTIKRAQVSVCESRGCIRAQRGGRETVCAGYRGQCGEKACNHPGRQDHDHAGHQGTYPGRAGQDHR